MIANQTYLSDWMNFYSKINEDYHVQYEAILKEELEYILVEAEVAKTPPVTTDGEGRIVRRGADVSSKVVRSAASTASKGAKAVADGAKGKLKEFWKKLLEKIRELWRRFTTSIDGFVKSDVNWLKKYKDKILSASLNNFEYEIFPYWQGSNTLAATKVPAFADNNPEFLEALKDEDTFRAKYFPTIKDVAGTDSFVEEIKVAFRGGPSVSLKGSAFKSRLPGMIDYCMKYADIKRLVEKDYANVERSVAKANSQTVRAQQEQQRASIRNGTASADILTLESFILEDQAMQEVAAKRKEQEERRSGQVSRENNRFKDNVDKSTMRTDKQDATGGMDNSTPEKASDNLESIRRYVVICQKVLGAKMSIYEERYREYMKLLRKIAPLNSTSSNASYKGSVGELQRDKKRLQELDAEQRAEVEKLIAQRDQESGMLRKLGKTLSIAQRTKDPKYAGIQKKIDALDAKIDKFFQGA